MNLYRPALALLCLLASSGAWGQAGSVSENLDSTVLSARRRSPVLSLGKAGVQRVDIGGLASIPSVLGNADPVRFLTSLPGVATGNELDAGLHIQGSESSHSAVMMQGAPVYGAKHLLGIFSVFTPSHFSSLHFSQTARDANRLGGEVDIRLPEDIPARTRLDLSAGLVSASGTIRQPLGSRTALSLSGRGSFIKYLYKNLVTIEGDPLDYGFGDMNLSVVSRPGREDLLVFNLYTGSDAAHYVGSANSLGLDARWRNSIASASWKHASLEQQLYWSGYDLDMDMSFNSLQAALPSGISTLGYLARYAFGRWRLGLETAWHDALLQYPYIDGAYSGGDGSAERQTGLESSLWGSWTLDFTQELSAELSLRGTHFLDPERHGHFALDPSGTLRYSLHDAGRIELSAGAGRQYLFQTGVSNLGLPCEFWFLAGSHAGPQRSLYGILSYNAELLGGVYAVKADLYYRRLRGQVEYSGDILDFLGGGYDLDDHLLHGSGRNFGASLMLQRQAGRLTGWLAYSFGRSLRSFDVPGYAGEYPANHERLHELNMVASWDARRWSAGLSVVAASGTPFTAPDSFYLLGGRIVSHYGAHNSGRLAPYFRTDLSFNWYFIRNGSETFGLNFSLYNATMRRNQLLCRLYVKDRNFAYGPLRMGFSILPSLSIFYRI